MAKSTRRPRSIGELGGPVDGRDEGPEEGALLKLGSSEAVGTEEGALLKLGSNEAVGTEEGALLKLGWLEGDALGFFDGRGLGGILTTLLSRVTLPFRAMARPTSVPPSLMVMLLEASTFPIKILP
jgi:hypothetical protein